MAPVTTAEGVLNIARSLLGYRETPAGSNRTKFGDAYGSHGAWCAVFLWYCFRQAGADNLIMQRTAYTPTLADWYMKRKRFDTAPRPGDLVFYNWPDSTNRIQHVGIVESVEPSAIVAIEGNTAVTNQSDGGQVMRRRRARNSSIVGYGHPAYAAPAFEEDDLTSEQDAMLRACYHELTLRLPNRRGPDGAFIENGGDDTSLGYSANADGFGYRVEMLLKQIADRVGAGGSGGPISMTAADRAAIAREVVDTLAGRIAP